MDKRIEEALLKERKRQEENIELIASENYASKDVLKLCGSILTNKYAEGYPGKRYYGGCENVDEIESIAIEYACKLFNCNFANVQPHSGSQANMAVYKALLNINDTVLGMNLDTGGHLTHGHPKSFSGIEYNCISYSVDDNGLIDYDEVEKLALLHKPRMIIAGASAYSRIIDFKRFREIADKCGAYLMVDMAHIAGLVATGLHPSPIEYADVVTSTTHKTLRGPRGGLILSNNEEIMKKINSTIFPGIQGGPLEHIIAAKAQMFYEDLQIEYKDYCTHVVENAKELANSLAEEGFKIISGTTDNHMFLMDVKSSSKLNGKEAQYLLDSIHITANKNMIPNDLEKPNVTSGLRLGSPAMTTRGLKKEDFYHIGKIIAKALKNSDDKQLLDKLKEEVLEITSMYPLFYE